MNNNFSSLLIALLIFVIGIPVASDLDLISLQMSRVLGASSLLAVGVWSLRGAGRLYSAGMLVAITGIVLSILSIVRDSDMLHVITLLAMFVFLLLATFNAFRQIAVGNDISPNRIVGAVCVYLLLGVMWSIAYNVLEYLQPDSFKGLTELVSPAWNPDWIYFSFVTLRQQSKTGSSGWCAGIRDCLHRRQLAVQFFWQNLHQNFQSSDLCLLIPGPQ